MVGIAPADIGVAEGGAGGCLWLEASLLFVDIFLSVEMNEDEI